MLFYLVFEGSVNKLFEIHDDELKFSMSSTILINAVFIPYTLYFEKFQNQFNTVIYCNLYCEQTDRFEALFLKPAFQKLFPSFEMTFHLMVLVFNLERSKDK